MQAIGRWFWRLGPGNPMVVRIVEGGSRRSQHLWVRMGYLGLLVALVVIGLLAGGGLRSTASLGELAQTGSSVFRVIAYGQVVGVCLLAPLFMAGAIASEQSGKTYNILLTTPLSNVQIVLGSLVGRLFFVLALLFSGLPLFAVVLVFGGVEVGSVFVAFAVAACTAVFVGSVAVTLSVFRAGGRKAVFIFVIAVAGYLLGVYAVDVGLLRPLQQSGGFGSTAATAASVGPSPISPAGGGGAPGGGGTSGGGVAYSGGGGGTTWLTAWHPLLVLESTMLSDYAPPPAEVRAAMGPVAGFLRGRPLLAFASLTLGSSLLMVLGCAVVLRRVGQGEAAWFIKLKKKLRLNQGEKTHAARDVTGNPIAWREANTRGKVFSGIVARWGYAALGAAAAAGLIWAYHTGRLPGLPSAAAGGTLSAHEVFHQALTVLLVLEVGVLTLVAIYMSAGCVSKEREDGTLDIMLTTPVTPKQYIWGKLRGLVRFLSLMIAVPVGTLAAVAVYSLIGRWRGWPETSFTQYVVSGYGTGGGRSIPDVPLLLPEVPVLLALMLVPFVALCVASGMAWSLKAKGVLGAVVPTVAIIGALVLVLGLCGWSPLGRAPLVGPVINGFSPATNAAMLVDPWDRLDGFAEGPAVGRVSLLIAALVAAGGYSAIVYGLIAGMVRGFDQTVRKLSGTG